MDEATRKAAAIQRVVAAVKEELGEGYTSEGAVDLLFSAALLMVGASRLGDWLRIIGIGHR